jgi:hypothetical protein
VRRLGRALAVVALTLVALGGDVAPVAAAEGSVAFADPAPETIEDRPAVRIVVDRVDLPVSRLVVTYSTEDATAVAGSDYLATTGSLVFDVGVRQAAFVVQVRNDTVAEATEHLVLRLTADRTSTTARMSIVDDDASSAAAAPSVASGSTASAAPADACAGRATRSSAPVSSDVAAAAAAARPQEQAVTVRRRTVVAPPTKRRVVLRQSPVTPFELRPATPADASTGSLPNEPTLVDPVLALLAGLLLARVAAEVWFRSRAVAG